MAAKRKTHHNAATSHNSGNSQNTKQQLHHAQQAHARGAMCMEDYIWTVMQCYAADVRAGRKARGQFAS